MPIIIPNSRIGTTSDVIAEQIALCKAVVKVIGEVAKVRKNREINEEIGRRLRICQDFLGMRGTRRYGCLYRQVGLNEKTPVVCEHAIPITALVSLYHKGELLEDLVFYPVARISKESDKKFGSLGLVVKGHDLGMPFRRYREADIKIEDHNGNPIDCTAWTMEKHWKLLDETKELSRIRNEVKDKLV